MAALAAAAVKRASQEPDPKALVARFRQQDSTADSETDDEVLAQHSSH